MYHVKLRKSNREQRKMRVRRRLMGKADALRLSIFRSNKYIIPKSKVCKEAKRKDSL